LLSTLSLRQKFSRDVLWNLGSIVVLGLAGIVINIVIASYSGSEALGIFNQVFAIYVLLSQLTVGGLQFSVLKHTSHHQSENIKCAEIALSALILSAGLTLLICIPVYLLRSFIGNLLDSPGVASGLMFAIPGLLFLSFNKVLLNVLNGRRHMRAYAIFQSFRYFLILLAVIALIFLSLPGPYLALSLTVSEVVLFIFLLFYINARLFRLKFYGGIQSWFAEHISFGSRGALSGAFSAVNTRVDVLMLGFFHSDKIVGIYSMAAIIAEGINQIPVVVRNNVDPIIGSLFAGGEYMKIKEVAQKVRKTFFPIMILIGIVSVLFYPILLNLLIVDKTFSESWLPFSILMLGIVLSSWYRPFLGMLLQGGSPGAHTLFLAGIAGSNVILNALMIPIFAMNGAAAATAIVNVLGAAAIIVYARKLFRMNL
jgi:O-antigen/teichoic acid export membrane protein